MSFLVHYIATLIYAAAGFAVGYGLPRHVPGLDPQLSYAFGGLVLLCLMLLHVVCTLGGLRRHTAHELAGLRESYGEAMAELAAARGEARQIHEVIQAAENERKANAGKGGGHGKLRNFDDVVAEVRVLQGLIERLSSGAERPPALAAVAAGPAPSDALQAAVAGGAGDEAFAGPRWRDQMAPVPAVAASARPAAEPDRPRLPPVARDLDDEGLLHVVREGLNCDRVQLVLQPIVKLPQRKHQFYECFSRILDGNGKMIVPDQYLEIARKAQLIAPIDNMLLFRCVQLVRRVQRAQHNVGFFCNISSHSLSDTPFLRDFIAFMAENTDLAPKLVFEFAQADVAAMSEEVAYNLHRLGDLGFRFSMDQVTSLQMDYAELARHRFRYLKIEAETLISNIRATDQDIDVHYFKEMLDRLGIDLIVEKFEHEADLVELLDFDIDYGQGYLFGEPRLSRVS